MTRPPITPPRTWRQRLRRRAASRGTPERLWLFTALVTVGALAVGGTGIALAHSLRATATTATERTSPAVVDAARATALLADADRAAAQTLLPPGAWGGLREPYQQDMGTAQEALSRAADVDTTGARGAAWVQSVSGLLVSYVGFLTSAVGAADQPGTAGAATPGPDTPAARPDQQAVSLDLVYLAYASDLIREPNGILNTVTAFQKANSDNLPGPGSGPWVLLGCHLAAALALLCLLIAGHRFLRRRFHRRVSLGLLGFVVVLVLLSAGLTTATVRTADRLEHAVDQTHSLACLWQARAAAAIAAHDRIVATYNSGMPGGDHLVLGASGSAGSLPAAAGCPARPTEVRTLAAADATNERAYQNADHELGIYLDEQAGDLTRTLAAAPPSASLPWMTAVGMLALLALCGAAFGPRIREYAI